MHRILSSVSQSNPFVSFLPLIAQMLSHCIHQGTIHICFPSLHFLVLLPQSTNACTSFSQCVLHKGTNHVNHRTLLHSVTGIHQKLIQWRASFFFLQLQSMTCVHFSLCNIHLLCGSQILLMCSNGTAMQSFIHSPCSVFVSTQSCWREYLKGKFLKMIFISQTINTYVVVLEMVISPPIKLQLLNFFHQRVSAASQT